MPTVIRFPRTTGAEASQIVTLINNDANFSVGGGASGVSIRFWKTTEVDGDESPFTDAVIEFSAAAAVTIGNGATERVGLYGWRAGQVYLLGVLGISLGGAAPQIPLVAGTGVITRFSQVVCNVSLYDSLSVGSVLAAFAAAQPVTVTARPIRRRDYAG